MDRLSALFPPVRVMAEKTLLACKKAGLDVYIPETGLVRTEKDQIKIYGEEKFTLHYLGLAVDIQPHLKCKMSEFKARFNGWPMWDKVQKDYAVDAGFDPPGSWQLHRDRPHCQCLFGIPEDTLRYMYYATKNIPGNIATIGNYILLHNHNKGAI